MRSVDARVSKLGTDLSSIKRLANTVLAQRDTRLGVIHV